ncbi:2418_t:CDS:2, partial [Acaulospora morrowiae]
MENYLNEESNHVSRSTSRTTSSATEVSTSVSRSMRDVSWYRQLWWNTGNFHHKAMWSEAT